jgi:hypothetical protein
MVRVNQRVAVCNVKLFKIDVVQKHVDTAKIVGGNIYLLSVETLPYIFLADFYQFSSKYSRSANRDCGKGCFLNIAQVA